MKIGVVGLGRIGLMHATNLATLDAVEAVLLYDPVTGKSAEAAGAVGTKARSVADPDALLSDSDGVLVATPTGSHPDIVRRAISADTPVLCEKPLAGSLAETESLVVDIEATGLPVVVGFHRRFDPATVEVYRRLRSGEAGRVYLVRAVCNDADPPPPEFIASSGGLVKDCLIHDLDAVPWLVGDEVEEVYASGSVLVNSSFAEVGDWDNVVATLRFAGGAHALLSAGRHDPVGYDCRTEVFTSADSLGIGVDARTPLHSAEPDGPRLSPNAYSSFQERYRPAYLNEMRVFTEIVAGKASNPSPARDSLTSLRLAEACEESARAGKPVRVGQ